MTTAPRPRDHRGRFTTTRPDPVGDVLTDAVAAAIGYYREHRPGRARFVLVRAQLRAERMLREEAA